MLNKLKGEKYFKYVKQNKLELLVTAIVSIVTYLPFFMGDMYNADSFTYGVFYHSNSYGWENNQGRFLLRIWDFWRDRMVLPSLITALSIVLLLAAVVILWSVFELKSPFFKIFLGIFVICAPSIADLFTYTYTADAYCFAILLSTLAGMLLIKGEKWLTAVGAGAALVSVLGIYQVYIGITITICSFWLIMKLVDNSISIKIIIQKMLRFLIVGVAAVSIYWIIFTLLDRIKYLTKTTARGADNAIQNVFANLLQSITKAYQIFGEYFFSDTIVYNSWHGRKYINAFIVVLIILLFVVTVYQKKLYNSIGRLLFSGLLMMLVPAMLGIVIIMAPESNVYAETGILMLGYMNFLYILLILLSERIVFPQIQIISYLSLMYLVILFCVFIGVFARMLQAESNKFQMLAYGMENRLEQLDEYESGMKVLVVGRPQSGNYPFVDDTYKTITKGMISDYSLTFGRADQVSNSWIELFKYYCGVNYERVTDEERETILDSQQLQDMGIYPSKDCVQKMGDIAVIRLSE